ncbi:MAG: metal-dependent hydrolase [Peptostreptococcaceae bacterium]
MTYKTHILGGMVTGYTVAYALPLSQRLIFTAVAGIGALLPDIDHKESFIRKFIWVFPKIRHRGHTHSLYGLLIFSLIIIPFSINTLTTGLICGYMSHILLDAFTVSGVRLFYPNERSYRLGRIRAGKAGEEIFYYLLWLVIIIYLYIKFKGV